MIGALWRALLDLLLPTPCGGCDAVVEPGQGLCATCRAELARPVPAPELPGLPPAMALAPYRGAPRRVVIAYKERGRRDLAAPLAAALAAALAQALPRGPCVLVPAPSRPGAARARGGDHMLGLARAVAAGTDHVVLPALRLSWRARDSVGLDARERAANLTAHLRLRRRVRPGDGRPVVLLDDVLTTGATARTCARALAAAGLPVDLVLVVTAVGARRPVVPGGRPTRGTPARHLPATRRSR
ncbi:ComF family protein [Actinomycetospora soli]|uniref:ComF family protein n=1 Tax=Actinomycetospora soli TaxID=2893887 RepID=UPI001E30C2A4|nr:double zinc ribbon domain-containing protein [Actinomycetospora soli]MCD2189140.1 double zinc ribbon domain-containing protein [Actinomycetospora soli]